HTNDKPPEGEPYHRWTRCPPPRSAPTHLGNWDPGRRAPVLPATAPPRSVPPEPPTPPHGRGGRTDPMAPRPRWTTPHASFAAACGLSPPSSSSLPFREAGQTCHGVHGERAHGHARCDNGRAGLG